MNSNTLFKIFGYFILSLCVFTVRAADTLVPSVVPVGKPDRGVGGSTGVRGAVRPTARATGVITMVEADVAESVVADDPAIKTAELAKEAAEAQAKEADSQEKKATAAKGVAEEQSKLAIGGVADVQAAATTAEKVSSETKAAKTSAEAIPKEKEAIKEVTNVLEKAKVVQEAAKSAQAKAEEAVKAHKASLEAANIAKARAEKADKLDTVANKPTAKVAKEQADAAEKSAKTAEEASTAATEFATAANEAKLSVDKLVQEAEEHQKDASKAVKALMEKEKPSTPVKPPTSVPVHPPSSTPVKPTTDEKLPDKPNKPLMNYVKDEKYDYQDQLLKEDRCSEDDKKKAKCKKNSNCYLDHTKPVCICFPGFHSDDASKNSCTAVDKPTCKNEANTCHRNANCKESKTLGIGCQCKEDFAGDGLLCSSAFSYVMNFFLVLAIISVQLYM